MSHKDNPAERPVVAPEGYRPATAYKGRLIHAIDEKDKALCGRVPSGGYLGYTMIDDSQTRLRIRVNCRGCIAAMKEK